MSGLPMFLVDAFTEVRFRGNPAAVCLLDRPRSEAWMQDVAREMNQAETAFLAPRGEDFDLRWFTPTVEVDLCGHATLGSAHVLWEAARLPPDATARFQTRSGLLTAERDGAWIRLDFPATPAAPAEAPPGLFEALGVTGGSVLRSKFDYLVVLEDPAALRSLAPNLDRLRRIESRGVIVTCLPEGDEADFLSRFFAPQVGVDEDPVTGSAHCALAPYWAGRLGRTALVGRQISARGGVVRVEHRGDRVTLAGQAVITLKGELLSGA